MHRLGTVLASSYHEDALRHAATMRRVQGQPRIVATAESDAKPSLRQRLVSAFRPVPTRHAGA